MNSWDGGRIDSFEESELHIPRVDEGPDLLKLADASRDVTPRYDW